jgi:hypothetical protein
MRKERIARHRPRVQAYTKYLGKWDVNSPVVGGMAPPTNEGRAFIRVARPFNGTRSHWALALVECHKIHPVDHTRLISIIVPNEKGGSRPCTRMP